MKKGDIQKIMAAGEQTLVSVDPDTKTEISRRQIDGVIADMKKHLSKRRKVHVILIRE